GKKNGVNILKSIDEGLFQTGIVRETLAEGTEGAPHLGPERPRVYYDLSPEEKDRYNADIRATNIFLQGLPKDNYTLINHYTDARDIWDNVKMLLEGSELTKEDRESQLMQLNSKFVSNMLPEWGRFVTAVKLNMGLRDSNYDQLYAYLKQHEGRLNRGQGNNPRGGGAAGYGRAQNRVGNANSGQARQIKCYNCNGIGHVARNRTQPKRPQNFDYFKDTILLMQAHENGVALDEEQLLFLAGGQDKAIDEDVDEKPIQDLALNMDNVFHADDCDAFDSDILSEVHDHDHYQDDVCKHREEHEMHHNVQLNHVVNSHADYTNDSHMISHDQYVKDNAMQGVQSNVSYVPNDAYLMIYNDMYEPHAQYVFKTSRNTVVDNSLTAELATYNEQVELYERRARFELTEIEQKIDEQLRIVITDRNFKEETLKKEIYSVKLQLASTINHNKSMVEEVKSLKKDFKQKENKYLKDFLDMKSLKENIEDRLYKQDQSLQTVHMLCKPKPYYHELNKVAIGYKNPLCLTRAKQVKIAPPDYSKENFLATFTPQRQLTPEQIFWSQDLIKMKAEALKEQTTASRLIKALTMYPPNIPAMLFPKVLPTKSQVKINIFTLIQLFSEFDKTYKKRITPTGLTEGERGLEQTKECYLKEVILFFKTLKEHFEGIQKALTKEIKEMKDVFKELEAEVAQNVVDRRHGEIERKNLLIANDNLIVECLSKEVFYVATNSELNVSRFTKLHVANTIVKARCLELEAELSNLRDKSHNDNHNELVNRFSNLEVHHLNLQLKYQNLKDSFGNNPPTPAKDTPDFDLVFVIGKMQASLQGKDNVIKQLKKQISHLQKTRSEADCTLDFRALDSQITQLTKEVTVLQAQNDMFRAENGKIKQYYKELYDSIKITRAKHIEQVTALTTENVNLKAQILNNVNSVSKDHVKPTVFAPESVETIREIVEEAKVIRPLDSSIVYACRYTKHSQELLEYAIGICPQDSYQQDKKHAPAPLIRKKQVTFAIQYSGCSKHMTGDRSRLMNFVKKFIETVRFGNDNFGAIMGYEDYVIGDSVISRTVPMTPQQNVVVERRNRTLVEAARTMLIFSKVPMFLWAEAMATACYTQNRSRSIQPLPPPPPPAGPSGTSGSPRASGSSQLPLYPPPPSTSQSDHSKSTAGLSSLKTADSAEYTAWTTTDIRLRPYVLSILEDLHMDDDMAADEQVYSFGDEDIRNAHIPKTDDMAIFMDRFCKKQWITALKPQDLEGPAFELVKVFHPDQTTTTGFPPGQVTIQSDFFFNKDLEYLRYGSKGGRPALSISKMKAAYYPDVGLEQMVPNQMWIEEECKYDIAAMYGISHWWFQRQRFYIDRHTSKGDRRAVRTHMRILSVVRIKVFSMYGYDYMKKIVIRQADLNEHIIAERDFKYLYPSDFEDLYLLNLHGHLNHLPPKDKKILTTAVNLWTRHLVIRQRYDFTIIDSPRAVTFKDKYGVQTIMRFNEIHKLSDGTLHQIDEALDYRVKDFKVNRMNPGLNTRFWTRKDVDRSKEFMFAIQKRLKTRRIFRNLERFVGGRVKKGDYRLLQRTE
nr:putative ribonuclease H-like domain-containing protein [Tanacetum cinerariifolium]